MSARDAWAFCPHWELVSQCDVCSFERDLNRGPMPKNDTPEPVVEPDVAETDRLYPSPDLPEGTYTLVSAGDPVPAHLYGCDYIERP